jgi:adenylate cyclase
MRDKARSRVNHDARDTILLGLMGSVGFLILQIFFPALVNYPANWELPLLMRFRPQPKVSGTVVIAAIDDQTVDRMGRPPWTAKQYADLISALGEYGARVVSLPVRLKKGYSAPAVLQAQPETGDSLRPAVGKEISEASSAGEVPLIDALKRQGATYLEYGASFSSESTIALHLPDTARADAVADTKFMSAIGAVIYKIVWQPPARHMADEILGGPSALTPVPSMKYYFGPSATLAKASLGTVISSPCCGASDLGAILAGARIGDVYYASLPVALVSRYLSDAPITLTRSGSWIDEIAVGNTVIPVNSWGDMEVNLRSPDVIPRFSVSDIIERKVKPSDLKGKIVLVGEMIDKSIPTYAGPRDRVEVYASAVEDTLSGQFLQYTSAGEVLAGLLVLPLAWWILAWCVTRPKAAALWVFGFIVLATALSFASDALQLASRGVVNTSVGEAGGWALVYSGAAFVVISRRRRERTRFRTAFEHYLDPKIIDAVMLDPAGLELGGEKRHLTILFADIVDFTTKAEALGPEALVETLNTFMSAMTEVVIKSGGVVDKIVGDSIMAFWGAPARVENSPRLAIDCGLEMLQQLRRLREQDSRFAEFDMGVGIATGEAVVGNLGGETRFDYSVVGDIVNLAARLESLTRQLKVSLLVNEQCYREAGGNYVARDLGLIRVKGKKQPAAIWEIAGRESEVADHSYYTSFSEALDAARKTRQADALERFQQLAELKPEDVALKLYVVLLGSRDDLEPEELILEFSTK